MKPKLLAALLCLCTYTAQCWGFYAHRQINYYAVFLLPPQMLQLYKPHILFLADHAVDPDKRRYAVPQEAPRHYIDLDRYGAFPFDSLPRGWNAAVTRYTEDTLQAHGIVPWWIAIMQARLTEAFRQKDAARILKLSAELGHYVADAHVPLHATANYNGQLTGQQGIHGFWESRVPELLAASEWSFYLGKAVYIGNPQAFIWERVLQSAAAADTVLRTERDLSAAFNPDQKFAFEPRNGTLVRQYSTAFTKAFNQRLNGMVERRMQQSIAAVASLWFTAWVDAGQPVLQTGAQPLFTLEDEQEWEQLNNAWKGGGTLQRAHE
ncbi:zinc dependent phospholipase C family protein [Paracnuella aquatica]|uniref:zinc dependent phospholipase C family protein n=1 Tax=Paracnuella aquatica TaxID=2268757 RepID=UPI000DEEAD44|nr:zinc dependent phospholipase C family protein [Paracnuella aquatica]RPD48130.1 S1/P1 Nuclease [Paracnuella aquatica]